jgi:hypothetical protein
MTQMQVSEQQAWEERTGWVEDPSGSGRHPVRWVTGSRKQQPESWPMLSAWDHARPVSRYGEHAYLLMPYGISEFGEQQLSEWCAEREMRWEVVDGAGWWHPATIAILVRSAA